MTLVFIDFNTINRGKNSHRYFGPHLWSTIASDIGGNHVISLTENEFNNHISVQMIETIYSNSSFQFKHINTKDVQDLFENLNPRKSCSDTGLMPKLMKKVAEGIAPSVTNLYN